MQPLQSYGVTAPGFYGLNTESSPTDLESGFALTAVNCIIDQYGRMGARKGWTAINSSTGALGANPVTAIGEHVDTNGAMTLLFTGNKKIFKMSSGAFVELTYGGGGVAPTITADLWDTISMDGFFLFFQLGHDPLAYIPSVSTTQYRRLSEASGYSGTVQLADVVIGGFGRIWNAVTTTDKSTVQWSDTKNPQKWTTGTAGSLDLTTVWPSGGDVIVGMGAHNNRLFIFGSKHVLIYKDAHTPSTMSLEDVIHGIGAISKGTITNTGSDIIFLSRSGLRSVLRTIQEKSAPLRDISKNVRSDLLRYIEIEDPTLIAAAFSPVDAFYVIHFPTHDMTFCFDTKQALQDGAGRVTTWTGWCPSAMHVSLDGTFYVGKTGYVGTYSGYTDNGRTYRMSYYTTYTDFGTPLQTSIIKRIAVVVIGGSNQVVTTKWGYDYNGGVFSQQATVSGEVDPQYNISEYNIGEFSDGIKIQTLYSQGQGSGKNAQIGIETIINGYSLSIQKLEIYAKNGKLA